MEQCDVAIVGGGPAGLSAAIRLAELGITSVIVLEREQQAGGIPRHCGHWGFGWHSHHRIWTGPRFAEQLCRDAAELDVRTGHSVLGIEERRLRVQNQAGVSELVAKHMLVATGTRESTRAARLVGGSRPLGVMNTGALQAHVYLRHHKPFERPVIVGSEWVSFSAILTCRHLGIRPVAMLEENDRISAPRPGALVARLALGVPVWTGAKLLSIGGDRNVEAVEIERWGERMWVACDGVIFTGGFVPEASLLADRPDVELAGNVHGPLKSSGRCWLDGRRAAERLAIGLR